MSQRLDDIRRDLRRTLGGDGNSIFLGVVKEVNEEEFSCVVCRDEQVNYYDVRLRSLINSELQGFAFIPKVGSMVLVGCIGSSRELFIAQYGEIDKIYFTSAYLTLKVDSDKISIAKGEKVSINIDATSLTCVSDQSTIKVSTAGLTLTKGSSGLKKTLEDLLAAIQALTVTTAVGPSGPPINIADFIKIQQDLPNYMEG